MLCGPLSKTTFGVIFSHTNPMKKKTYTCSDKSFRVMRLKIYIKCHGASWWCCFNFERETVHTVDGWNPKQPPRMYGNPTNNGINYHINWLAGFQPSVHSSHVQFPSIQQGQSFPLRTRKIRPTATSALHLWQSNSNLYTCSTLWSNTTSRSNKKVYTSSARTSRGRKFPKGKELYSKERICL